MYYVLPSCQSQCCCCRTSWKNWEFGMYRNALYSSNCLFWFNTNVGSVHLTYYNMLHFITHIFAGIQLLKVLPSNFPVLCRIGYLEVCICVWIQHFPLWNDVCRTETGWRANTNYLEGLYRLFTKPCRVSLTCTPYIWSILIHHDSQMALPSVNHPSDVQTFLTNCFNNHTNKYCLLFCISV